MFDEYYKHLKPMFIEQARAFMAAGLFTEEEIRRYLDYAVKFGTEE